MSYLTAVEVAICALLLMAGAIVLLLNLRRRRLAGGGPLMLCAVRTPGEPRWRLGLMRLGGSSLDFFSVVGPSMRPVHTWQRLDLDFGAPTRVTEQIPGLPDAVAVSGTADGRSCDLALHRGAQTALRAWLESSPPGYNVNVA